jgi:hypothetical protein
MSEQSVGFASNLSQSQIQSDENGTKSVDSKSTEEFAGITEPTPFEDHIAHTRMIKKPARISKRFGFFDEVKQKSLLRTTGIRNNQLLYLTASQNILEYGAVKKSADVIMQKHRLEESPEFKRQKYEFVQEKLSQNRNPNVINILKDIASESVSPIQALKNRLKSEYNRFIESSIMGQIEKQQQTQTVETVKDADEKQVVTKPGDEWNFLTELDDNNRKQTATNEQMELIDLKMKMMFNEHLEKCDSRTSSRTTLLSESLDFGARVYNDADVSLNETRVKLKSIKSGDMQIALIDSDLSEPVNGLQMMLNEIKQVYLPTFQPELHQVCQYGKSYELVKLLTNVRICPFFLTELVQKL